jgi:hypothetical protein
MRAVLPLSTILVVVLAGNAQAGPATSGDPLAMTCSMVRIEMPAKFGSGWRLSQIKYTYPSMSVAQFRYLGQHGLGSNCVEHRAYSSGYQIGAWYFPIHGQVTATVVMSGCAPNGHRIFAKVPIRLPNPPTVIKLRDQDVRDRGKCG